MSTIEISGHPLPESMRFSAEVDEIYVGEGYLLSLGQAMRLLDAWENAPKDDDTVRAYDYCEAGVFATSLTMEGTANVSFWECVDSADDPYFNTAQMPFDFDIREVN